MSNDIRDITIPFIDLKVRGALHQEYIDKISDVLHSGMFINGYKVSKFCYRFEDYNSEGTRTSVGVGNGFDALQIALMLSIAERDEISRVIVPANAPLPVPMAVTAVGCTPYFVDPDEHTMNLSVAGIDRAVYNFDEGGGGGGIVGIVAVDLYGNPCPIKEIVQYAKHQSLFVIEDCSQAHGASVGGKKVGNFTDFSVFSFYPTKNLAACGDAGVLSCADEEHVMAARDIARYGGGKFPGINSRMDDIQAAILDINLRYLDGWNAIRKENAEYYLELLADCEEVALPENMPGRVWHQFVIKCSNRQLLMDRLEDEYGIETAIHYPISPPDMPYYKGLANCPVAANLSDTVVSLPVAEHINLRQVEYIAKAVKECLKN
jgi:dTDP-4-amino-4,6-dideoxygalactose transaminase